MLKIIRSDRAESLVEALGDTYVRESRPFDHPVIAVSGQMAGVVGQGLATRYGVFIQDTVSPRALIDQILLSRGEFIIRIIP